MTDKGQEQSRLRGFPLFTILGFEIRLNLSWLLLGLLITWTLAEGFFPQRYADLGAQARWWMGVAGAVGVFFSIVFHELSHSLVGRRCGMPVGGITLFIFGGIAELRHEPKTPYTEFLMAVAGPLSSLVLAGVFFVADHLAQRLGWPVPVVGVLHYLSLINVILAVFNLLPAYPLDGGRMFRAALWAWRKDVREATRVASRVGSLFGLALMILGVLAFLTGDIVGGMWSFLIGAFLRGAAMTSYRQLLTRQFLEGKIVADLMNDQPVSVAPSITLEEFLEQYVYRKPQVLYPVVDDSRLVGCVKVSQVKAIPEEFRGDRNVSDILSPCSEENTVSPDDDAAELLGRMLVPGVVDRKIVESDGRLVGTISLQDLRNIMELKLELESQDTR
jgi:Zn-dependent protease